MWAGFALVHAWLTFLGVVVLPSNSFHDVDLYRYWVWLGVDGGIWPVVGGDWVYPAGAIVPMLIPALVSTTSTVAYALAWCALVTLLDGLAVWVMLRRGRSTVGSWWWIAFLGLLGPVAMGRLDAIIVPPTIVALVVAARHPRVASALLTAGAWIKVAPGAIVVALVLAVRRPWRDVVLPAAIVSAVVVGAVAVAGGAERVLSFMSEQGTRGLQIEAVGATPWVLAGLFTDSVDRYLNEAISTFEISGPGSDVAVDVLGIALVVALAAVTALLWWVRRRAGGAELSPAFLVRAALILMTVLIVFNKVGSPQYVAWLAAPVAVALALRIPRARTTALLVLVIAGLTQIVFPLFYTEVLYGGVAVSLVLVVRNILLVVLLVQSIRDLVRADPTGHDPVGTVPDAAAAIQASR